MKLDSENEIRKCINLILEVEFTMPIRQKMNIDVPNDIKDGNYLLQLQITNFIRDAAPSRPLLFSIVEK